MPRKTRPLINWHGDSWSNVIGDAIDRRLANHRSKIEEVIRPIYEKNLTEFEINRPAAQDAFETELNALTQDLSNALRRSWSILRDIDRAGSEANIYHTLKELISKPELIMSRIWHVDLATRSLIEDHHPDGPLVSRQPQLDRIV